MQALGTWICDEFGENCYWHQYAARVNETSLEVEYVEPYPGTPKKRILYGPIPVNKAGCGEFPYGATLGNFPPLTKPGAEGGKWEIHIHHIKPLEFGGTHDFQNLVPLHRTIHYLFNSWWGNFKP